MALAELSTFERSPYELRREVLAVPAPLDELFPYGGPTLGGVLTVEGATSLVLSLAAAASAKGQWAAAVGMPQLGLAAAAEAGVDLERFVLVPDPKDQWARVVAALVDGVDLVVVTPPRNARQAEARQVAARVREKRGILVVAGGWPVQPELTIRLDSSEWTGLGDGYGRLTGRRTRYSASGRGAAARPRSVALEKSAAEKTATVA